MSFARKEMIKIKLFSRGPLVELTRYDLVVSFVFRCHLILIFFVSNAVMLINAMMILSVFNDFFESLQIESKDSED